MVLCRWCGPPAGSTIQSSLSIPRAGGARGLNFPSIRAQPCSTPCAKRSPPMETKRLGGACRLTAWPGIFPGMPRLSSMAGCTIWLGKEESERWRYHLNSSVSASAMGSAQREERYGREHFERYGHQLSVRSNRGQQCAARDGGFLGRLVPSVPYACSYGG